MQWIQLGTFVTTSLTAIAALTAVALGHTLAGETRAELRDEQQELRKHLEANFDRLTRFTRRSFDHKWDTCQGTEGGLSCTFTNTNLEGATNVCVRATIANKESSGIRLTSMPLCSGRLAPSTTVTIQTEWNRGKPSEICNSAGAFGHKQLDWSKCSLEIDDLSEPTPPAAAANAAPTPPNTVNPAASRSDEAWHVAQ